MRIVVLREARETQVIGEKTEDDAYLMLAYYIVGHYNEKQIRQAIYDDDWLKARVQEDCMNLDLCGPFLDTIMQDVDEHNRLWLRAHLKKLGSELFTKLDLKKLRKRILQIIASPDL